MSLPSTGDWWPTVERGTGVTSIYNVAAKDTPLILSFDSVLGTFVTSNGDNVPYAKMYRASSDANVGVTIDDASWVDVGGGLLTSVDDYTGGLFSVAATSSTSSFKYLGTPDVLLRIHAIVNVDSAALGSVKHYRYRFRKNADAVTSEAVFGDGNVGTHTAVLDCFVAASTGDEVGLQFILSGGDGGPHNVEVRSKQFVVEIVNNIP